jgi:hypothetical protein
MPSGDRSPTIEGDELETGWRWFEFHAAQRISAFKFFLTIYAASGGIALALLDKGYAGFGLLAGIFTFYIPFLFWSMDKRSRQLTEIGESIIDAQWKNRGFESILNPIQRATHDPSRGRRFKTIFRRLFWLGCIAAIGIIVWALILLEQQYGLYKLLSTFSDRVREFLPRT